MPPGPTIKPDNRLLYVEPENPWLAKMGEEFNIIKEDILMTGAATIIKQNHSFVIYQKPDCNTQIYGRIVKIEATHDNEAHHRHDGVPFLISDDKA
jgi:hypothetical protein